MSSATSSSSSVHSVDSEDMYADLASPVSSASSRSPTPAQTKKERGMQDPYSGAGPGAGWRGEEERCGTVVSHWHDIVLLSVHMGTSDQEFVTGRKI